MSNQIISVNDAIHEQQITVGANPGAGNNFSLTIPSFRQSELVAASFILTTDANAADRYVEVNFDKLGIMKVASGCSVAQVANKAYQYSFNQQSSTVIDLSVVNLLIVPCFKRFKAFPGDDFNIIVHNKQVGDAITVINFTFNTWIVEKP